MRYNVHGHMHTPTEPGLRETIRLLEGFCKSEILQNNHKRVRELQAERKAVILCAEQTTQILAQALHDLLMHIERFSKAQIFPALRGECLCNTQCCITRKETDQALSNEMLETYASLAFYLTS